MAGETVTIACKLPHGLLLQHQVLEKESVPVMGGGFKEVDRWRKTGKVVRINGCAVPQDKPNNGIQISHGAAFTFGVEKDFWTKWLEQNRHTEIVERKMIFAAGGQANAEAQAKEMSQYISGFERTDPKNLPAEFRRKGAEIQTASVGASA